MTKLETLIEAAYPVIYVATPEEERLFQELARITEKAELDLYSWDISAGFRKYVDDEYTVISPELDVNIAVLENFVNADVNGVLVLPDIHRLFHDAAAVRLVRNLLHLRHLDGTKIVLLCSPFIELPVELRRQVATVDFPLPTRDEIKDFLLEQEVDVPKEYFPGAEDLPGVIDGCRGLTMLEVENVLANCLAEHTLLEAGRVIQEKKEILRGAKSLEYIETPLEMHKDVGGLENVIEWLELRRKAFTQEAVEFGIPAPKGLLLVGHPGCLHADTLIHDPVDGSTKRVEDRFREGTPFHVTANSNGGPVVTNADAPYQYPKTELLRVTLSSGEEITVAPGHRFWTGTSWISALQIDELLQQGEPSPRLTSSGLSRTTPGAGAPHLREKAAGCQGDYRPVPRSGDALLRPGPESGRGSLLPPNGARGRTPCGLLPGGQAGAGGCTHQRLCSDHLSTPGSGDLFGYSFRSLSDGGKTLLGEQLTQSAPRSPAVTSLGSASLRPQRLVPGSIPSSSAESECGQPQCTCLGTQSGDASAPPTRVKPLLHVGWKTPPAGQLQLSNAQPGTKLELLPSVLSSSACISPSSGLRVTTDKCTQFVEVVKVEPAGVDHYYDFHVPHYENYEACGVWNHNTGKSLIAKAVGGSYKFPLLRFNMGAAFSKWQGESEAEIRNAWDTAVACAPCILIMDEIDKATGGLGGDGDNGTGNRILGDLLTKMQENDHGVVVVATCNDVQSMPAAMLRKGRFDEIIFVDLPGPKAVKAILEIHLRKRKQAPLADFADREKVISLMLGMTGAEIEQTVIDAMYFAFNESRRLESKDLIAAATKTKPYCVLKEEEVKWMRKWAEHRAVPASSEELDLAKVLDLRKRLGQGPPADTPTSMVKKLRAKRR